MLRSCRVGISQREHTNQTGSRQAKTDRDKGQDQVGKDSQAGNMENNLANDHRSGAILRE